MGAVFWLRGGKNGHDLVDCVSALDLNAASYLSRVNPGVPKGLSPSPFSSHTHPSPPVFLTPAVGLDLARDLVSAGPRFSHHVPTSENRPNHSTASAGSVLTQSPGEEL